MSRKFIIHNIKILLDVQRESGYEALAIARASKIVRRDSFFSCCGKAEFGIFKRSIDARDKNAIKLVFSVFFWYKDENCDANRADIEKISEICTRSGIVLSSKDGFCIPDFCGKIPPVVCGFGPCGMFAALILARSGACPIVIERGGDADERVKLVEKYWRDGELSEKTNVQFGEGGAGTFSDGKLMTRINDPLCSFVLETMEAHGADPDILINAKPHVGTDKLRNIVKSIRREIISLGGTVHFNCELTSVEMSSSGDRVKIGINGESESIETDALFLAVGHSARNTFSMLHKAGIEMCAKPFSVGVRIEHLQRDIDFSLYGSFAGHKALTKGEYALSCRVGERAAYTFCMCPGGTVVASASEKESIVTNGMSYSARDGENANSAVAVSVSVEDFGNNPFSAMEFQANIERCAYKCAGLSGAAPIQTVGGFLGTGRSEPSNVLPTYTGKTAVTEISKVFPNFVTDTLKAGLLNFDKKIKGFADPGAVLTAPETRTSSPVKLPRDDRHLALGYSCIYTCGEGAGYAGGITSAAVDGIRSAMVYLSKNKAF